VRGHTNAAKVMPLHDTLEAPSFRPAADIDNITLRKGIDADFLPDLKLRPVENAELRDEAQWFHSAPLEVPFQWLVHKPLFDFIKAQLDSFVPIPVFRPDLGDVARTGFDDGAGNHLPVVIKDTCHSNLFAENAAHCSAPESSPCRFTRCVRTRLSIQNGYT
jgi:hypothetical protein